MTDDRFYAALVEDDPEELYEHAPCAYLSALPDGTIVKVNETFLRWTGFERDVLIRGRRFQDLLAPGDRIFYETHFSPLLRMQGQVREIAVEVVGRSGTGLPVLVNAVLTHDTHGLPATIRIALFDATERRKYEQELVAARHRAEEAEARATALARTLQASFIPLAILPVPGVDIAGAYRPAGDGSEVGGDFYDVFDTGQDSWAVVLGDVCGKGAGAAVLTSLVRYTARAEAIRSRSPSAVLGGLHDALLRYHPDEFCTAVFARLDVASDRVRLTLASGGHHLPLRLSAEGSFDRLGEPGLIVGMVPSQERRDTVVSLRPGDVVVLFTDGVLEAGAGEELFEEDRLREVVRAVRDTTAQAIADAIVSAALDFQAGVARDDIAVVVIKVPA